jgi:hypothetical protein
VVGYYQANERFEDCDLGGGRRAADAVEAVFPDSVALVVSPPVSRASVLGLTDFR